MSAGSVSIRPPAVTWAISHIAEFGQKGYHGVAIVSRLPFAKQFSKAFCGKEDCRHVSVTFGRQETRHHS